MVPFASRTCYLCKAAANKNLEPSWQTWEHTCAGHNDRPTLPYSISGRYKGFWYQPLKYIGNMLVYFTEKHFGQATAKIAKAHCRGNDQ